MPQKTYPRIRITMSRDGTGLAHWTAYRVRSPRDKPFPMLAREALSDAHTAATRIAGL